MFAFVSRETFLYIGFIICPLFTVQWCWIWFMWCTIIHHWQAGQRYWFESTSSQKWNRQESHGSQM